MHSVYNNMLRKLPHVTSPAGLELFTELVTVCDFVRPIPWLDKLTVGQQARVVEIERYAQYKGWVPLVDEWMNTWPLLSLDTESAIRSPLPSTVQVAFGKSMWTFIFCMDGLRDKRSSWGLNDDVTVMDLLPSHLHIICITRILVLWSLVGLKKNIFRECTVMTFKI